RFLENPGMLILVDGKPLWVAEQTEQIYANGFAMVTADAETVTTQIVINDEDHVGGRVADYATMDFATGNLHRQSEEATDEVRPEDDNAEPIVSSRDAD